MFFPGQNDNGTGNHWRSKQLRACIFDASMFTQNFICYLQFLCICIIVRFLEHQNDRKKWVVAKVALKRIVPLCVDCSFSAGEYIGNVWLYILQLPRDLAWPLWRANVGVTLSRSLVIYKLYWKTACRCIDAVWS